jgi:formamidopyrimidine-DNA glycosylase
MPELPEVQTIVNDLNRKVNGYLIDDFWSDWHKAINIPYLEFVKKIKGKTIENVERKGKYLIFYLSEQLVMIVHLKMTGHLLVKYPLVVLKASKVALENQDYFSDRVNQYIHHIWRLKHKSKKGSGIISLEFSDLRKFGKIKLISKAQLATEKSLIKIGLDPFARAFTREYFREIFHTKKEKNIRNLLMDQEIISGIGNIYVSEILFDCGISPKRKVGLISEQEQLALYFSIRKILKKALELRGTSDSDYRDTAGAPGGFQKFLKVYNREGAACQRKGCKGTVKREKINQRSAYYCHLCQV